MPESSELSLLVGHLVRLARDRHERDLASAEARGLWYDAAAADRAVRFFGYLRHSKGEWAGKPFHLERWQQDDIIRPLFGWKRSDGTRRFRTAYISIARKNGKSPLAAGIALYLLIADKEPGAEVYSAATKKEQAQITHKYAAEMLLRSPELKRHALIAKDRENYRSIYVPRLRALYQPVGADANTLDGLSTHGGIIDELHAHKTRKVWDVIQTSTSARRQPLMLAITTAGYDRHTICYEIHDYAVKVLEQALIDDSFFGYIASIDDGDDWRNEEVWVKANPNLGISKKIDYMRGEFVKAKNSPAYQNTFRRLDLNQWTEQSSRAIDMAEWHACKGSVREDDLRGRQCYGGLDLSSTRDITALDLEFPVEIDGRKVYKGLTFFWLPEESIRRLADKDRIPYDAWAQQGLIKLTPGNVVDYDIVRADINALRDKFDVEEIAYDPWNATEIAAKLQGDGFKVVECRQGYRTLSEPTDKFLGMILDRRIEHGGNLVLNWMASNLAIATDAAGNMKPDKAKSSQKIDGIVAKIMALARATLTEEAGGSPITVF